MATPPPRLHLVHFSVDAADEDATTTTTNERRRGRGPTRSARSSGATRPPREIHRPGACRSTPSRVWRLWDRATAACAVPRRWRRSWARAPAPRTSSRTRPSARSPTRSCASSRQTIVVVVGAPRGVAVGDGAVRSRRGGARRRRRLATDEGVRARLRDRRGGPPRRPHAHLYTRRTRARRAAARVADGQGHRGAGGDRVERAFERAGVGEVRAAAAAVGQARRALEGDAKGGG